MKIAILYTAYRQFAELLLTPSFFDRQRELQELDVIFHCNNPEIDQTELQRRLSAIHANSMTLMRADKNCGYGYGQFEAICDVWDRLQQGGWDWVIHLHPDIYVTDAKIMLAAIEKASRADAALMVGRIFGLRHSSFGTDAFAFRPSRVPFELFSSYQTLVPQEAIVPLEVLFFIEIHRHRLPYYLADRFASGRYFRDPDLLGLWHEHNLQRVADYLKAPNHRWRVTRRRCLAHPVRTARTAAAWLYNNAKKRPNDSLPQRLTLI